MINASNLGVKRWFTGSAAALALLGGAVTAVAVTAVPAAAQKRDREPKPAKPAKQQFSPAFVTAYKPAETLVNAPTRDGPAMRALVPAVIAAASTPDDKLVAGNYVYATGRAVNDTSLQLQGIEMMLSSGKVSATGVGELNSVGAQLAFQQKNYAKARTLASAAVAANYTKDDPQLLIGESYFAEQQPQQGIAALDQAIAARKAAGQPVPAGWLRRALAMSYNAKLTNEATRYAYEYATQYPSLTSWGDAIVIIRNTTDLTDPEVLDLSRLHDRTGTFREEQQYLEFVEAADPRRLPVEVVRVMDAGYASGKLARSNRFASDAYAQAKARVAQDRADVKALEQAAKASSAPMRTVMAAADTLLSHGEAARAEALYTRVIDMPGVDKPTAMLRLGIAQFDQGKFAQAKETFGKVDGRRASMARLWAAYADQKVRNVPMGPATTTS